jgi:hypothetical protein
MAVASATAKGPTYADPQKTDSDFALQGEYTGEIQTDQGSEKFGVQVVALGGGKFRAVGYHGGLPGDGWNKEERVTAEGEVKEGTVRFQGERGSGVLKDGVLIVSNDNGDAVGELRRVERQSPTLGAEPPPGAIVLFDGTGTQQWNGGRMTPDGLLMEGTTSKQKFADHKIHIEFRLPYQPEDRGQARGNSGIYVQGRYEVQMLDSFGLEGKDNECGGIYTVKAPDINMCLPPLSWQTYDIQFTAAKYDDQGNLLEKPRITVDHNGFPIHRDVKLSVSSATRAAPVQPSAQPGPIHLQNHGNPVRYRNIWVVETK